MVGRTDRLWTGVCLKDEFQDLEPRLEAEEDREQVTGTVDPILFKDASCPTGSPRTYFSQGLAENMRMVVAHLVALQRELVEELGTRASRQKRQSTSPQTLRDWLEYAPLCLGLVRRSIKGLRVKPETFLKEAEITNGFPQLPLLQSLRDDIVAIRSLGVLMQCCNEPRDIEDQLKQYVEPREDLRRPGRSTGKFPSFKSPTLRTTYL